MPAETILFVILFLVPLAVFFSALFLGLALRAQSFKEAQNTLTPVQLASMIPMMLPLIPGISLTYAVAMVPIGGVALLFRELMTGDPPMGPSVVALVATIAYAVMALRFAARSFGREEVLFGASGASTPTGGARQLLADWRTKGRRQPEPAEALAFVAVVALLYFYLGTSIQLRLGETGILLSQVALMGIPALLFVGLGGYGSERGLAFRRPSGRALGGAVLVIVGGIPIAWLLGWIQSLFMEIPTEFLEAFEELVRAETVGEIAWLVLIVALTPAICEELVFRGVLLQGLSSRMTMTRAVGTSAVIFGLFHLSVETAIRFLPSAWLGLVLGYVVWHTRSIVTSMVMHFINNGFIVLVLAYPRIESEIAGPNGEPRWYLVAGGLLLFFLGMRVLPRRDPEPEAIPEWPV